MIKHKQLEVVYQQLEQDLHTLPLGTRGEPTVPGDGDAEAELLFIGEAPGFNESQQRRPFTGRSGQLLAKVLVDVGYARERVFITNIVKVRPPENRDPSPTEIAAYQPYLDREIEIIQPQIIITLGRLSMQKFLPDAKISQVHGRLHKIDWKNTHVFILPMYHPAAALRSQQVQTAFLHDFQKIPKILEWVKTKGQVELKEGADQSEFEISINNALI